MSNTRALVNQVLTERFGSPALPAPTRRRSARPSPDGRDALVVMPTGSGKSLWLPAAGHRSGRDDPRHQPRSSALIEDQVAKLRADGFRAERIHSGRDRLDSRQVCRDYLAENLDFLFIAPERLSVPGFPEFLAKRLPALIAVDEAHCISTLGPRTFRPAYRTLGEHLPALRPAPILALTATATVRVQKDIVQRLGMSRPEMFIRGFWRDNLAVEARDCARKERDDIVRGLLDEADSRPAIVYVPTRKEAERLASVLGDIGAVPYHAGMEPPARARSQEDFMAGRAPVVVATVAFGMGGSTRPISVRSSTRA